MCEAAGLSPDPKPWLMMGKIRVTIWVIGVINLCVYMYAGAYKGTYRHILGVYSGDVWRYLGVYEDI